MFRQVVLNTFRLALHSGWESAAGHSEESSLGGKEWESCGGWREWNIDPRKGHISVPELKGC